jgi:hypothetical protein
MLRTISICVAAALVAMCVTVACAQSCINVKDFGAKGDGQTDDTAAIRAAAAKLTGVGAPYPGTAYYSESQELYFPPGKYQISDTLPLPNRVRGDGAVIEQTDPTKAIFETTNAWRMTISGFTFLGGARHIVLQNPNLDTGQIHIEKCRFYGAKEFALHVDIVSTTLTIRDCVFLECMQVWYHKGCDQAIMSDCWITTAAGMRNKAAIEHRAGRLTIENLCGVPLVNGADQRWIDNYGGNLTLRGVRFGGEGGGFTPVVNLARYGAVWGPTILLEDCFVCANGNAKRNCAVYCEEVPNQLHIRDSMLAGAVLVQLREDLDLARYFRASGPEVFSFTAEGNTGIKAGKLPELLAKPKVNPLPPKGISEAHTRQALQRAVEAVKPHSNEDATGGEHNGHRQQTDPGKLVDLGPTSTKWHLNDFMDATAERNSEHLAMAAVGTDMVLMRRTEATDNWPHVTIEGVSIDLDKTPWLTWKQKGAGSGAPGTWAVRVLDLDRGTELLLEEAWSSPWDGYRAYNLRDLLKQSGVRRLRIKYYYLGVQPVEKKAIVAKPGDYAVLDFLRAESE